MSQHDFEKMTEAEQLMDKFKDFANRYHGKDTQAFLNQQFSRHHRTLQQNMMRFMFGIIEHVASDNYLTDARNEESKKVAQEILKGFQSLPKHEGTKPSEWLSFI